MRGRTCQVQSLTPPAEGSHVEGDKGERSSKRCWRATVRQDPCPKFAKRSFLYSSLCKQLPGAYKPWPLASLQAENSASPRWETPSASTLFLMEKWLSTATVQTPPPHAHPASQPINEELPTLLMPKTTFSTKKMQQKQGDNSGMCHSKCSPSFFGWWYSQKGLPSTLQHPGGLTAKTTVCQGH